MLVWVEGLGPQTLSPSIYVRFWFFLKAKMCIFHTRWALTQEEDRECETIQGVNMWLFCCYLQQCGPSAVCHLYSFKKAHVELGLYFSDALYHSSKIKLEWMNCIRWLMIQWFYILWPSRLASHYPLFSTVLCPLQSTIRKNWQILLYTVHTYHWNWCCYCQLSLYCIVFKNVLTKLESRHKTLFKLKLMHTIMEIHIQTHRQSTELREVKKWTKTRWAATRLKYSRS